MCISSSKTILLFFISFNAELIRIMAWEVELETVVNSWPGTKEIRGHADQMLALRSQLVLILMIQLEAQHSDSLGIMGIWMKKSTLLLYRLLIWFVQCWGYVFYIYRIWCNAIVISHCYWEHSLYIKMCIYILFKVLSYWSLNFICAIFYWINIWTKCSNSIEKNVHN